MFQYTPNDNIETTDANVIVNTVNTVGVMGKGVALAVKNRYPDVFKRYAEICKAGELKPGGVCQMNTKDGRRVINIATKDDWRGDSKPEWVGASLVYLSRLLMHRLDATGGKPFSVALPMAGCGNGGISWPVVHQMMQTYLRRPAEAGIEIRIIGEEPGMVALDDCYAGVGARATPGPVLDAMRDIAAGLEDLEWTLRSGGAAGADTAFYDGLTDEGHQPRRGEIFTIESSNPKRKGVVIPGEIKIIPDVHFRMMKTYHPAPHKLGSDAAKLMTRNGAQVFGINFTNPSRALVCWTPGGKAGGGTGQAIRIATSVGIPVIDLGDPANRGMSPADVVDRVNEMRYLASEKKQGETFSLASGSM